MALSRTKRRKVAKERALAKACRIAKAAKAYELDKVREIVSKPKRRREGWTIDETGCLIGGYGYYGNSCLSDIASQSHRGYVCRASGSMSNRATLALKARGLL